MSRVRIAAGDTANSTSQESDSPEGPEGAERLSDEERRKLLLKIKKALALATHPNTHPRIHDAAIAAIARMLKRLGMSMEEAAAAIAALDMEDEDSQDNQSNAGTADDDLWQDIDPDRWPDPVDGKELLRDLEHLIERHIVMTKRQRMVCALWILHAHAHDAARTSPILIITAPHEGCGKTQLMQLLSYLVPNPFGSDDATPASIQEATNRKETILLDEAENFVPGSPQMRSILRSGHTPKGRVTRKGVHYSTWAPRAIALNDHDRLDTATQSRAIIIKLKRKLAEDEVEDLLSPVGNDLKRKAERWAADNYAALRDAQPDFYRTNRDRDNWLPLLAIADLCGFPGKVRNTAREILGERRQKISDKIQIIHDMRTLFKRKATAMLASTDIVRWLARMESRDWATYERGGPLNTKSLAKLLDNHEIRPKDIEWPDGRRANGYRENQFQDVFRRYPPQKPK